MSVKTFSSDTAFPAKCNVTKYDVWKEQAYHGPLSKLPSFWIYQTQPQIALSQELAFALSLGDCKKSFQNLFDFKAGRNGPIDIQHSFKSMCTPTCLESDNLIQAIMKFTGCSCLDLSTQVNDPLYTVEGDLCRQNTGRLLCDLIGYCGLWDCRLGDFMCPRYEFNKKVIPFKNKLGSCDKIPTSDGGLRHTPTTFMMLAILLALFVILR